jgi:gamma-glutamyltranspeptidase/glutathione hydrolase
MQQAVDAPRFHHQWLPDVVKVEATSFDSITINELENKGYIIDYKNASSIGKVDAILVLPDGSLEAGADKRGDDTAVGF